MILATLDAIVSKLTADCNKSELLSFIAMPINSLLTAVKTALQN